MPSSKNQGRRLVIKGTGPRPRPAKKAWPPGKPPGGLLKPKKG